MPTIFVRRASDDPEGEIADLRRLAHDLGAGEGILIYPEGTRHTAEKAGAREGDDRRAPARRSRRSPRGSSNVLPPRLGGPLALIDESRGADMVMCAHVGFDGFEYISDIWAGGLVGATVQVRLWRFASGEIPATRKSGSPGCTSAGSSSTTGSAPRTTAEVVVGLHVRDWPCFLPSSVRSLCT